MDHRTLRASRNAPRPGASARSNRCNGPRVSARSRTCARYRPARLAIGAGAGPSHSKPVRVSKRTRGLKKDRRRALVGRLRAHEREVPRGREPGHRALLERERGEGRITVGDQPLQQRMFGAVCLDQDLARAVRTTGAPGDLEDQLRHALARAKVGAEKPAVGVDDADERHEREVVAFRQHLRTDEDARLAALGLTEQPVEFALAARRVAVDAHEREPGKGLAEHALDAFGAEADRKHGFGAARRAATRDRLLVSAMVTTQAPVTAMHGHARVATAALRQPAAIVALEHGRVAPPVQEQQDLRAGIEVLTHALQQGVGEALLERPTADVEQAHRRRGRRARALGQVQRAVPVPASPESALPGCWSVPASRT